MGCKPMRLNPLSIDADGVIHVDTDRFFGRTQYDASQAVPAVTGTTFNDAGLELLAVASEPQTAEEE